MYRRLPVWLVAVCLSVTTVTTAADSPFHYPIDIVAADDGTIYVADLRLPGIWKIVDGKAEVFVKGEKTFRTPLNAIRCLAIDPEGALLAGDSATREIYRISKSGELTPLTKGMVGIPMCLAVDAEHIYASDLELQRIWKIPMAGGEPQEHAVIAAVRGMSFDSDGQLWIATGATPAVAKIKSDGSVTPVVKDQTFAFTNQLAVGNDGSLYVADGYSKAIWKVSADGECQKWVEGEPFVNPVGLTWQGDQLLVVDSRANAIFSITPAGERSTLFPVE